MTTTTQPHLQEVLADAFLERLEEAGITDTDALAVVQSPYNTVGKELVQHIRLLNGQTALPKGLTLRHVRILLLISNGVPHKAILGELAISAATLKREIQTIYNLLGVGDRAHAVAMAIRSGRIS